MSTQRAAESLRRKLARRVARHPDRCEFCKCVMEPDHGGWLCRCCKMWRNA